MRISKDLKDFKKFVLSSTLALITLSSTCFFNSYNFHAKENIENENLVSYKITVSDKENKFETVLTEGEVASNNKNSANTENSKSKEEKIDPELKRVLRLAGIKEILKHPFKLVFSASLAGMLGRLFCDVVTLTFIPHAKVVLPIVTSLCSLIVGVMDCYEDGVEKKTNELSLKQKK